MGNTADSLGAAHTVLVVGEAGIAELADIMSVISAIIYILATVFARSAISIVGNALTVVRGQPVFVSAIAIGVSYGNGRRRTAQTYDVLLRYIARVVVGVGGFEP